METADAIGHVLGGRYHIASLVGTGSMSTVYRATQTEGPDVAVKLLKTHLAHPKTASERLMREAQVISRLDHPGCVRLLDWGVEGKTPFVVLELVSGQSLSQLLAERVTLDEAEAVGIIADVCEVLHAAHELGVIHRDLKPGNIMVLPQGSVKVLDFGLARLAPRQSADETQPKELTRPGSTLGTPSYMAPEQVRGSQVDGRADLYACGVILFELVSGELPIVGETAIDTMLKQATDPPRKLRDAKPDADNQLEGVVMRCLAKNNDNRFQTALELREALLALPMVARLPPVPDPEGTGTQIRKQPDKPFDPEETATQIRPQGVPAKRIPSARMRAGVSEPASERLLGVNRAPRREGGSGTDPPKGILKPSSPPPPKRRPKPPPSDTNTNKRQKADSATKLRREPSERRSEARAEKLAGAEANWQSDTSDKEHTTSRRQRADTAKTVQQNLPLKLPLPSLPKVKVIESEVTRVRAQQPDFSEMELTIPAVGAGSKDVSDFEATIPAVSPSQRSDPDATQAAQTADAATKLHDMADWASTRKLKAMKAQQQALGMPDSTTPMQPIDDEVEVERVTVEVQDRAPASRRPMDSMPRQPDPSFPPRRMMMSSARPPQASTAALNEVLSGIPQDERRWLIGAAIFGVLAAIALAVWLLL